MMVIRQLELGLWGGLGLTKLQLFIIVYTIFIPTMVLWSLSGYVFISLYTNEVFLILNK